MKKLFISICFVVVIALIAYYKTHPLSASVTIKGKTYLVDIAITDKDKQQGLKGKTVLDGHKGMLFLHDHKAQYTYTMDGMRIPLDFLWIDGNQIMDITKNVPVASVGGTPTVISNVKIDKVLELPGGQVDAQGILVGDTVLFNK